MHSNLLSSWSSQTIHRHWAIFIVCLNKSLLLGWLFPSRWNHGTPADPNDSSLSAVTPTSKLPFDHAQLQVSHRAAASKMHLAASGLAVALLFPTVALSLPQPPTILSPTALPEQRTCVDCVELCEIDVSECVDIGCFKDGVSDMCIAKLCEQHKTDFQ